MSARLLKNTFQPILVLDCAGARLVYIIQTRYPKHAEDACYNLVILSWQLKLW